MTRRLWRGLAVLLLMAAAPTWAGDIDPGLQQVLDTAPTDETLSTLVYVRNAVDIAALNRELNASRAPLQERHETVVRTLQSTAASTQADLRDHLKALQLGNRIDSFKAYWVANVIRVDATPPEIVQLATHPDVERICPNYPIELIRPETEHYAEPTLNQEAPRGPRSPEIGLVAIRAPEVWAAGYTGQGVLVSTLDTGVDGSHAALASRWRGVADPRYVGHPEWAFFDPVTGWTFPQDSGSHGTHTMGTVCGGAPGDEIGVAPGAQWIHAAVIDRVSLSQTISDAILAFEWLIDPDENPATNWDVPAVCSNSWGIGTWHNVPPYSTPCDPSFWSYLDACEAAGIVILFSAGNEGSSANTLRRPADRATDDYHTCAVGGIDANNHPNWTIYSSSSRGPTYCTPTGDPAIKPEVAAPAVSVRSAIPGGYGTMTGTSMASPHVNGVVALIREACPDLSVDDVKQILYDTAVDQGTPGKDNDYGYGVVDAYEAVLLAESMCGPSPPRVYDGYYETAVDTPVLIALLASDYDGQPDPPGALSYQIRSLPNMPLTDLGNGHVITAGELPYTLALGGNQVAYGPSGGYYGTDTFLFGANDGGTPPDGGDSEDGTITVLVLYGPPVITTTTLPDGCLNRTYGPIYLEADQGQPELTWTTITDEYVEVDLGSCQFATLGTARGWHADDSSWSYSLPFTFPFFGNDYSSVYVCSNGYLDFGTSAADYSNSDSELISNTRIATLWDDLETDCGGDGDIYIDDSVGGQVTVRWAAQQFPCGAKRDVSVTLFDDGTIQFNYGPTNTGLSPTIGISSGDGTRYLLASYNNAASLTNANSLEFLQPVPLPQGILLQPDGALTGLPTEFGTFQPRFKVTDSLDRSDVTQLTLLINEDCPYELGDLNCDGLVDTFDVDPFVLALTDPAGYATQYPDCDASLADCNQDGAVNTFDIDAFVDLLN